MTTTNLIGGVNQNQFGGSAGSGLLGGIGSLLNGLVSATGGGGTLSGGVSSDGSVAPQYYSGGLFGIGAKTIPGLTAAPKNVTYADSVQGYALNPPNIPSAAPLALSPMQSPTMILPGYASNGGAGIQGGGGYAVPTVASLPGAPGGAAPGGGPVQAPMSQAAPQMVSGGDGSAMPQGRAPLQGYVSNQPAQPGQAPWMGQIGQLAQGAADFAGNLFGGQPAYAATPARNNSGLVPPPPPLTPGVMPATAPPRAMTPQQAMQQAGQQQPQQPSPTFGDVVNEKFGLANQLASTLGGEAFGTPNVYASLDELQGKLDKQAKQVAAGVDVYAKQLRDAYKKAINTRFNTPRADLPNYQTGEPMTVIQYRNQLESQIQALQNSQHKIAQDHIGPQDIANARQTVTAANEAYARSLDAMAQPTTAPSGIYGLFGRTRPGNPLAASEAQRYRDPVLLDQAAVDLATRAFRAEQAHRLQMNAIQMQDREARVAAINKELSEATGRASEGEKLIFEMRKQATQSFYEAAKLNLDGFISVNNLAAADFRHTVDGLQARAAQHTLDERLMLEAKKFGNESETKTRDLEAKVAQQAGAQELNAMNSNTARINALTSLLKNPETSEEMKAALNKEILQLVNTKPNTSSVIKQGPTVEALKATAKSL